MTDEEIQEHVEALVRFREEFSKLWMTPLRKECECGTETDRHSHWCPKDEK